MNGKPSSKSLPIQRMLGAALAFVLAGAALIGAFLAARNGRAVEAEPDRSLKVPSRVTSANGVPIITLDAAAQQRNGIETAGPMPASYRQEVRAYGMVLDLARLTDLSNSYVSAKSQLQTAQAKVSASKPAFERARSLYQTGQSVSLAQFQTAEATFRGDEAAVAAAETRLHTLIATAHQEWGPILAKSLTDGSAMVNRLIERQEFLLQITLPPGTANFQPPATASIETAKGERAPISHISAATRADPRIQSVSFFYGVAADSGLLPGMNVLAFVPTGTTVEGVIVPAAAIVWWQDRAWAYRRISAEIFSRVMIPTDQPAPAGGFVVRDLPKDSEIVTSGAQLLLSEEFRAQIQVGGN